MLPRGSNAACFDLPSMVVGLNTLRDTCLQKEKGRALASVPLESFQKLFRIVGCTREDDL